MPRARDSTKVLQPPDAPPVPRARQVGGGIDPVMLQGITDEVERQRKALKSPGRALALAAATQVSR